VTFKIINRLKVINNNIKFNGDFKSPIIVGRTLKKHIAFHIYIYIYIYSGYPVAHVQMVDRI
jgi:hypothetical protein